MSSTLVPTIADDASSARPPSVRRSSRGTFVSLYAGAGGLDIGFMQAGFTPVWVNEFDPLAARTHSKEIVRLSQEQPGQSAIRTEQVVGDITAVDFSKIPKGVDLVIGGPPCQGFSVAGKMDPLDLRSEHVYHFMNVVDQVRPQVFVMENVKALYLNRRWQTVRDRLTSAAAAMGYKWSLYLLNAADYGVPQARERMFLVGSKIEQPTEPIASTSRNRVSVRTGLAALPRFGSPGNNNGGRAVITLARRPVLRRSAYAGMLFNGAGRPLHLDRPALTLPASMGGNKTPIVDQSWIDDANTESWVERYHRRLWNGGDAEGWEVPADLRRITVEEAAALQTFPNGMQFDGPISAQYRQIGNAVPPRLARAVALSISLN